MLSRRSHGQDVVDDDDDDDDHKGGDEVVVDDDGDGAATHYDLEPSCLVGGWDVSTTKKTPNFTCTGMKSTVACGTEGSRAVSHTPLLWNPYP